MNHQELNQLTGKLMMSPTMQRLAEMASGMPLDPLNHDDLKTGLASCMFDVEDALAQLKQWRLCPRNGRR
jgi:hypothetical protein